ncbi:MAG TPA: hypothetical protein ENK50_02290 [Sedimenticola sp.]|nr:hypothetical protein [Sedimenticola sp.]
MGLLKTYLLVLIVGWVAWFWMGQPAREQPPRQPPQRGAPYVPGPAASPYPGGYPTAGGGRPPVTATPPRGGDMVDDFQYGVDLVKAGAYRQSFHYLWRRQSWVAAGIITLLVSFLLPGFGRSLRRWRATRPPQP